MFNTLPLLINGIIPGLVISNIPGLNLDVPVAIDGVDTTLLNPIQTWKDKVEYQKYLNELVEKFQENFTKFDVSTEIVSAGPKL